MTLIDVMSNLDDIYFKLRSSAQNLLHAHSYLIEGACEPEDTDYNALYVIYDYQTDLLDQMQKNLDELGDVYRRLLPESNTPDSPIAGKKA